jgi:hypothetical protein
MTLEKRVADLERKATPSKNMAVIYRHAGITYDRPYWEADARELTADEVAAIKAEHDPVFVLEYVQNWREGGEQ